MKGTKEDDGATSRHGSVERSSGTMVSRKPLQHVTHPTTTVSEGSSG